MRPATSTVRSRRQRLARGSAFPELVDCLLRYGISGLSIVDDNSHLVGMVTEADLVSKEG